MTKALEFKLKTNLLCKFVFIMTTFFVYFSFVNAQIVISEIMYNPEGSDTGKEWIEIYNNGSEQVDLIGWKLFEANTNHKINPAEEGGSLNIPANSYAVIVDKVDKFKENYPGFYGLIFDSAYSLSNTGESLIIRNSDLIDVDNINYSSEGGADGDGSSLQLIDGSWVSANPTMGEENNLSDSLPADEKPSNTFTKTSIKNSVTTDFPIEPQIFANAGKDRKIIVGADTMFEAKAFGLEKKPLQNARYSWSFGDGGSKEDQKVLYAYKYPSKYVVVLNVSSGEYVASDRVVVEALPSDIVIAEVNQKEGFIELFNRSDYELNLSWWRIRSGNEYFSLPKDTIILPDNKIRLSNKVTKFNYLDMNQIYLLYPNGEVVTKYGEVEKITSHSSSLQDEIILNLQNSKKYTVQKEKNLKQQALNHKQIINSDSPNSKQKETLGIEDSQLAFVGNPESKDNNILFNKWTFSLFGLVLISIVGVLFTKGFEQKTEEDDNYNEGLKPEDFKIIS